MQQVPGQWMLVDDTSIKLTCGSRITHPLALQNLPLCAYCFGVLVKCATVAMVKAYRNSTFAKYSTRLAHLKVIYDTIMW